MKLSLKSLSCWLFICLSGLLFCAGYAKASEIVWDTTSCSPLSYSTNPAGAYSQYRAYEFFATSTGYLTELKQFMRCNSAGGCDMHCYVWPKAAYRGVSNDKFSTYIASNTDQVAEQYVLNMAYATSTYTMYDLIGEPFEVATATPYTFGCWTDRGQIYVAQSNGYCYNPSGEGIYYTDFYTSDYRGLTSSFIFAGETGGTGNVYNTNNHPPIVKLTFDTNYVPPDINITTINLDFPDTADQITDFADFVIDYKMNQAQINYIQARNATLKAYVYLDGANQTQRYFTLDSQILTPTLASTTVYIPKSGLLDSGDYIATAYLTIEWDCDSGFCETQDIGDSQGIPFTIVPNIGNENLLSWRSDITAGRYTYCLVEHPDDCKLWFTYNDQALGKTVDLIPQTGCDQSGNYCKSAPFEENAVASTTVTFTANHQNFIPVPATTTEGVEVYDLLLVDDTFGNSSKGGIQVVWGSTSTVKDLLDSNLGLDARENAIDHACDDVASSTGLFDDLRYGVECGMRKFSAWALTPSEDALAQNQQYLMQLQNGFPFNVVSSINTAVTSLAAASSTPITLNLGGINSDFSGMTLLSTDQVDQITWYNQYLLPTLRLLIWLSCFGAIIGFLFTVMSPKKVEN